MVEINIHSQQVPPFRACREISKPPVQIFTDVSTSSTWNSLIVNNLQCSRFILAIALVLWLSCSFVAAQDVPKSVIEQNATNQAEIRDHTTAVEKQVQDLIDELEANGISGNDVKMLEAVKSKLTDLSGPEMTQVLEALKSAAADNNPVTSQQSAYTAYADQKSILSQLGHLLVEFEQHQAASRLAEKFRDLMDREGSTTKATEDVQRKFMNRPPLAMMLDRTLKTTVQVLESEQQSISDDLGSVTEQLNKAAQLNGQLNNPIQKAQDELKDGQIQLALNQASSDIQAGNLADALIQQKNARDQLRQIAKDLDPVSKAEALAQATSDLQKLIDSQKGLLDSTQAFRGNRTDLLQMDAKQGDLADDADTLQHDVQAVSPDAAGSIKEASKQMQESWKFLRPVTFASGKSTTAQQSAITSLQEAEQRLQKALADAKTSAADPDAQAKALDDLQKKIANAQQQQQQTSDQVKNALNNPAAPDNNALAQAQKDQATLQQQTADLAQEAQQAAASPATSADIQAAANAMDQAQKDLSNPNKMQNAQASQQAAQQALADAGKQLQKDAATTSPSPTPGDKSDPSQTAQNDPNSAATPEADPTDQLQKQLQDVQQQQQKASDQTKQALNDPAPSSGLNKLNQAKQSQKDVAEQAQAMQQQTAEVSPEAGQALQKAAESMDQAQKALSDPSKATNAPSAQKAAQDALADAKKKLDDAAEAEKTTPGQLSQAAKDLQQAQKALASSATPNSPSADPSKGSPSADAAKELSKANQALAAIAKNPSTPANVAASAKDAQNAIAQAQQSSGKGDSASASSQAAAAQQAVAQAQSQMAQSSSTAASPSSQQPGNPSQAQTPGATPPHGVGSGGNQGGNMTTASTNDGKFVSFISRDRAAIDQSKTEKRPEDYAPQIDQYLKNLADQSSSTP